MPVLSLYMQPRWRNLIGRSTTLLRRYSPMPLPSPSMRELLAIPPSKKSSTRLLSLISNASSGGEVQVLTNEQRECLRTRISRLYTHPSSHPRTKRKAVPPLESFAARGTHQHASQRTLHSSCCLCRQTLHAQWLLAELLKSARTHANPGVLRSRMTVAAVGIWRIWVELGRIL